MSLEEDLWSNLPADILDIILQRVPLHYHPRFASVCKNWNAICMHKLHRIEKTNPLLVHVKNWKSGIVNYYSPFWNITFQVKSPLALSESRFFSTKDGWLVLYKKVHEEEEEEEEVEVVLTNPATNVSYSYPGLTRDYLFTALTFAGCPGTENFVIFGITSEEWCDDCVSISVWKQGRWKLQLAHYENNVPFSMSPYSSPVVHNGSFYCVSENGKLGVFDPEKETWNILTSPKGFSFAISSKEVYLMESKSKMIAVVGGNHDPRVMLIFCLDYKKMLWKKVESLKAQSMFIGPKASIMINVPTNKNEEGIKKDGASEKVNDSENMDESQKMNVRKKVNDKQKVLNVYKKMDDSEKVNVGEKGIKNRIYTSRIYGKIELVEAEMKISGGSLFFVTKACDHGENRKGSRKGNILSYSLTTCKTGKYCGSSQYLFCAWYKPEISM